MYHYFVSFSYFDNDMIYFGNCELKRSSRISGIDSIRSMERTIANQLGLSVVIMHYTLI